MSNPYQTAIDAANEFIAQAYDVRKDFLDDIPPHDDVVALYEELRRTRNGLDRLDVLLGNSIRLKAKAENLKAKCAGDVEDAEIEVSEQKSNKSDYQSARDSGVALNAKTIGQRRKLRQATEAYVEVLAAVDIIRGFYRNLDSRRLDLTSGLKIVSFISVYEK